MRKFLVAVLAMVPAFAFAAITNSAHDFASSGSPIYFTGGSVRLCSFCHTAHHAPSVKGLWNRDLAKVDNSAYGADATFTSAGTTLPQNAAALNAPTKQCLSCHDGSTAINELYSNGTFSYMGNTVNGPNASHVDTAAGPGTNVMFTLNATGGALFTNLTGTHPVSTEYYSNRVVAAEYGAPSTTCVAGIANCTTAGLGAAKIFPNAGVASGFTVECASCHEPHRGESAIFLRNSPGVSICLNCHVK